MPQNQPVTIVNVGFRSTHYWVISAGRSRLLVDIGWPGMLGTMKACLKRMDIPLSELRFALATHYHIDHAGLAEELKGEGVPLLVLDIQTAAIPLMKQWTKPADNYREITPQGNIVISFAQSRDLLSRIGIAGEIVSTPGHTEHCVSVLLDDGSVFTGDLPAEHHAFGDPTILATWQMLRDRGAKRVYPAHGPLWELSEPLEPGPDCE